MVLILSESDIRTLVSMKEMVPAVEEAFLKQGLGQAVNSPRTRSVIADSSLNVMHASLSYLGRSGAKCYMSTKEGNRFVFVLFDTESGNILAMMAADVLGRYRTGAASAVATKHLARRKDLSLAIFGSGGQALTQVLAVAEVAAVRRVNVWSPTPSNREKFAGELAALGFDAKAASSPREAMAGTDVASAITSSARGFIEASDASSIVHMNLCGSNNPRGGEALPSIFQDFRQVVVDDLAQARYEAGDLIQAEKAGTFTWDRAVELKDIVAGKVAPSGRTVFKSHGVALEDVAAGSLVYDAAKKRGGYLEADFG